MIPTDYTITRKGMTCYLTPLPPKLIVDLIVKECSYEKPGREHMPNPQWGIVKLARARKDCVAFPVGLTFRVSSVIGQVRDKRPDLGITLTFVNATESPPLEKLVELPADRKYQDDAIETLMQNRGGMVCLPTGAGKTFTALKFVKQTQLLTTVVVHTLDLKRQWERVIAATEGLPKMHVTTYQSPLAHQYIMLSKCVIYDECHHVAAKTLYDTAIKTSCTGPTNRVIIGLTATPHREDNADLVLESVFGPIAYTVTRRYLINEGYLVDATVYYTFAPFVTGRFDDYATEYQRNIVDNKERNDSIKEIAWSELIAGRRVLILVDRIEHGQTILESLPSGSAVFLHGAVKNRDVDFDKTPIVIGTQIFNEGVDFPQLDTVILACGGKSATRLVQRVGRVLRAIPGKSKAKVFDFIDGSRLLKKHYLARRKILEDEFEVIEL